MKNNQPRFAFFFFVTVLFFLLGAYHFAWKGIGVVEADDLVLAEQDASIRAIAAAKPAVVSIVVYDDEEIQVVDTADGSQTVETEAKVKGRGTGFIISQDGYILTNKHVVEAASAKGSYRVILNSGKQYYGQLIGKDPISDLAILRIFDQNLPAVSLGDSDRLAVGQSAIAIGNTLGLYQNSATKGIVSALGRSIMASQGQAGTEAFDNVIQTDAEINPGNSGGPLIDLSGKVIGINTAIDDKGSSIGFAIPINDARPVVRSIIESGRIIRPKLGVRYLMLTPETAIDQGLGRMSGAWIWAGDGGEPAIMPGGPAEEAGLKEGDIVFEINAIKVEGHNTLMSIVQRYRPGSRIGLKVMRGQEVFVLVAELAEF